MARETKEQRMERETRGQTERAITQAEFQKTLPSRMKALEQMAIPLGIRVDVSLREDGPEVFFSHEDGSVDATLTFNSEEWEVTSLEDYFKQRKQEQEEVAAQRQMALDHYNSLSPSLQQALKAHIYRFR